MIEIIEGDLLASDEPVIAHGCNTCGVMGAGIAKQIAEKWPEVLTVNRSTCAVGTFVPGTAQRVNLDHRTTVFNLATQDEPGPRARYEWIELGFRNMAEQCVVLDVERVAIPQIGCGIGGLSWVRVEGFIESALRFVRNRGYQLEVVCYVLPPRP